MIPREDMPGEERQLVIPEGTRSDRADKVLAALCPELSRSRWQRLFREGRVWLEDRVLVQDDKLHAGDLVQFSLPPPRPAVLRPVPMPLAIVHEDEALLVLDKEPGRVVHPGAGTGEDTLVHGLLHHCRGALCGGGATERPGIVHRLDKETSGLLVVAKTEAAFLSLARQFAERRVEKCYTALTAGVPRPPEGVIEEPIGRHPVHRVRMACRTDGRPARSDYAVLRQWGGAVALVEVRIHTGRTHQIRVHLSHIGHPLLGDRLYGGGMARGPVDVPRVMLHAGRLAFTHPHSGRKVVFEAPLPPDFVAAMAALDRLFADAESR